MSIDLQTENLITISEAARLLPGRPHSSTVWRFHARGVKGVKLETIVSGGRRFTSQEAVERFIAATTLAVDGANSTASAAVMTSARKRQLAAADAVLAKAGI